MKQKNSNKKEASAERVSKEDLTASADHTNKRIDKLDNHMVAMVDKMGTLIEAQIRTEERDARNTETLTRLEDNQIKLGKEQKNYMKNNDDRSAVMEKQILLLEIDDKAEKDAKATADKNKDNRKNGIIIGLSILAIVATLQAIAPLIGK